MARPERDPTLIGRRFGMVVILEHTVSKKCKVRCDCGTVTEVYQQGLTNGERISCGCTKKPKVAPNRIELEPGDRSFALTYISEAEHVNGYRHIRCGCDCGNEVTIPSSHFTGGIVKSCGCYKKVTARETINAMHERDKGKARYNRIDYTGQRFGSLVAISFVQSGKAGSDWMFKCDCGNDTVRNVAKVKSGKTTSCPECGNARRKKFLREAPRDSRGATIG